MEWICKEFSELQLDELYAILAKRQQVFTVGQGIRYVDADGLDQEALHLCAWQQEKLVAYLRILPYDRAEFGAGWKIGRVLTCPERRSQGLGKELMQRCIQQLAQGAKHLPLTMSAQLYLEAFYQAQGFKRRGDVFLEEGIEHIRMDRLPES